MTSQIFKDFKEQTSQFKKNKEHFNSKIDFLRSERLAKILKFIRNTYYKALSLVIYWSLTFVAWKLSIKHHLINFFLFYQRCVLKAFLEKTIFWLAHFLAVYDKEQLVFFFKKLRNKFKERQYILKKHQLVQIFMRSL